MTDILEALVLRPGDTLILRVKPYVTREEADALAAEIAARLPGIDGVVIAAEQMAVYRPEATQ